MSEPVSWLFTLSLDDGRRANFAGRFLELMSPQAFTVDGRPGGDVRGALAAMGATYQLPIGGFSR